MRKHSYMQSPDHKKDPSIEANSLDNVFEKPSRMEESYIQSASAFYPNINEQDY